MKKTLKVFLVSALLAVLLAFCASAFGDLPSGKYGDNVYYEITDGVLTFSGSGPMLDTQGDIEAIPFSDFRSSIKKIVIEEGITTISFGSFVQFQDLEYVEIPQSVTYIAPFSFGMCSSLKEITLPENLEFIGSFAFAFCDSLTDITIPDKVETIEFGAFALSGIRNIKIPASVTNLSEIAFTYTDDDVDDVYAPVIENIFVDEENETYCDIDGVLFSKDKTKLITYPNGNPRTSYAVTEGTETICTGSLGAGAFCYSKSLETLVIPTSLKTIEEGAFFNCSSLKDIYYCGTEEEWNEISIGGYNDNLLNATIHFKHEHIYTKEIITEATCSAEGEALYTCDCGDSYKEAIPTTNHIDKNKDGNCDICQTQLREHKTLFQLLLELIHAVIDFFERIF